MSLTAIPLQFEKYLQNQISVGNGPDMNEMIFAYIPGLDLSQPIDRSQGLPDVSLWVHQQDIDQVGKLGDNALVYSVVIPGSVDAFTFNAIYLRDKNVPNSCGMVVHKADETKENGMASTKSLMQQYTGAAQIAGIDVDAATWQIDYQARLLGIEDDMRLANVDTYGHTAFVDGFDVVQQADPTKYAISPGVAYVGGLRAVLDDEIIQTINTKPNGLYLDVVRMGTALSQWQNVVTVRLSEVALSDYVDGNNQPHYVAKLAGINADGSVADWRVKGGLGEHVANSNAHPQYATNEDLNGKYNSLNEKINRLDGDSQFLPYDKLRIYEFGEVCYTRHPTSGEHKFWQWYSNVESLPDKDPSLVENRHTGWTDNTKPFYWIPYTGNQVGMPLFWLHTEAPEWAVMEMNVNLPVAVYWRLARTYPHLVSNGFINTGEIRGEFLRVLDQGRGVDANRVINSAQLDQMQGHEHFYGDARMAYCGPGGLNAMGVNSEDTHETDGLVSDGTNGSVRFGSETRSRNVARAMVIVI
ncbi:phage tail protein [Vibrio fluvialis]|nr:phage tail protein [Vibrio fluvialis]